MTDLLNNPAVQGGIAPFLVALLISVIFVRLSTLSGFALIAGFVTTVLLTTGLSFDPLTSTRKITLILLIAPFIGLFLDLLKLELECLPGRYLSRLPR